MFLRLNDKSDSIREEWNIKGAKYASEINEMVEYGEKYGWKNWKGQEPEDLRDHMADEVVKLLKEANKNNTVTQFRENFPPAHTPLIKFFQEKGQNIDQIHFIENEKVVFLTGTSYQKRQAYILDKEKVIKLESEIDAIGKSKKGNIFGISSNNKIITTKGWQGETIACIELSETQGLGITQLIPYNDGKKVLMVTSEGIYIISKDSELIVHPVQDLEEDKWNASLDMENATLSNDNKYVVVGDQDSNHRILNKNGEEIGEIGPQSSYAHFCLFSGDDSQLITNSCHFYNGITIGVSTEGLEGLKIDAYEENSLFKVIDDEMRVHAGVTMDDYYILGDAYGYIKAFDKDGNCIWRHFLGSTIGGIAISDDEKVLWVASCTGMIHKLKLGQGHRDDHTIGNGNHFEEFRLILWKDESIMRW